MSEVSNNFIHRAYFRGKISKWVKPKFQLRVILGTKQFLNQFFLIIVTNTVKNQILFRKSLVGILNRPASTKSGLDCCNRSTQRTELFKGEGAPGPGVRWGKKLLISIF
jgi:hypothetical protein